MCHASGVQFLDGKGQLLDPFNLLQLRYGFNAQPRLPAIVEALDANLDAAVTRPPDPPARPILDTFLQSVKGFIERESLLALGADVLVGVSGGVDSTVLLDTLHHLGYGTRVVHVNFGLRGIESDADEAFVQSFCKERRIQFTSQCVDANAYAQEHRVSVQMAARELRLRAFADQMASGDASVVAVGHHADDQAETVLLNLFRGTGPEGMAGMPAKRSLGMGTLVRPLLEQRREAIVQYALDAGLHWREDVSNTDTRYRRAQLRQIVFPSLEAALGPSALQNVARSAALMRQYVDETIRPRLQSIFDEIATDRKLSVPGLLELPPVWQRRVILEALRRWVPGTSTSTLDQVVDLLGVQAGKHCLLRHGIIWRGREYLIFDDGKVDERRSVSLQAIGDSARVGNQTLRLDRVFSLPADLDLRLPNEAYLDADRLQFPLVVRPWEAGDRMVPLGMNGSKKVSDILTDAKVPVDQRAAVHVVCSGNAIAWVVGVRIANEFRVRKHTQKVARLLLIPHSP